MQPGGAASFSSVLSPREAQLRRFDANADGEITRFEFEAVLKSDYEAADTNDDGMMSYAETRAANDLLKGTRDVSPIIDWNGDGNIGLEEYGAQWRTLFARADVNGDQLVSGKELMHPPTSDRPPTPVGPPGGMPPGGKPPGGKPPGQRPGDAR